LLFGTRFCNFEIYSQKFTYTTDNKYFTLQFSTNLKSFTMKKLFTLKMLCLLSYLMILGTMGWAQNSGTDDYPDPRSSSQVLPTHPDYVTTVSATGKVIIATVAGPLHDNGIQQLSKQGGENSSHTFFKKEVPYLDGKNENRVVPNNHLSSSGSNYFNANVGYLGIGTTAPLSRLHVYGSGNDNDITVTDQYPFLNLNHTIAAGNCGIAINYTGAGADAWIAYDYTNNVGLRISTSSSGYRDDFVMNPDGNVGIGTGAPEMPLHVYGTSPDDDVIFEGGFPFVCLNATGSSGNTGIIFEEADAEQAWIYHYGSSNYLKFTTDNSSSRNDLVIVNNGNVGVGTSNPTEKLTVNGHVKCKEVYVTTTNWPDYVFDDNYHLMNLNEVENYIKLNKHLPGVPCAGEINSEGLKVGEMNEVIVKKLEEVTLYLIEQEKQIQALKKENELLKSKIRED
jgi:hypothetical protein